MKTATFSLIMILMLLMKTPIAYSQNVDFLDSGIHSDNDIITESSLEKIEQLNVTKGGLKPRDSISFRNQETGLIEEYSTETSKMRFIVGFHMNSNPERFTEIRSLDFMLGYHFYENFWLSTFIQTTNAKYDSISEVNSARGVSNDIREENENLITFGAGFGYVSTYLRDFLNFDKMYESFTGHIGGAKLNEGFLDENFFGPGYRADWGIYFRTSKFFHAGFKLSWNHYSVKRAEAFLDEPQNRRHLSLTWLSLGFEGALYF